MLYPLDILKHNPWLVGIILSYLLVLGGIYGLIEASKVGKLLDTEEE